MNRRSVFKGRIKNLGPYLWIFLFGLVLLFIIISKQEFWTGYDSYFHMNAIYEDAMQIKTGHFSYFISLFGFERSGRIVNSLYGPIFSYLCGALLLWCHSWIRFEFSLFLITVVISGIETYICAKKLCLHKTLSTIIALFFMSSYPITVMWFTNWEFIGLGAAILIPMILIVGIDIYHRRQIKIVPLAISMALCLQIHLVTSLIAVLVLIPLVIGGFVQTNAKWKMVRNGLISLMITVCLSGNIFGALYDVFRTNHIIPTFPNFNLQSTGGNNSISVHKYMVTDLGYLYTFLVIVILILAMVEFRRVSKLDWYLLFEDLFFLLISSTYFPWNLLLRIYPGLSNVIQFPARFVGVVFILTLLLLGRMLSKIPMATNKQPIINAFLVIILIISLKPIFTVMNHESDIWRANSGVVHYWAHHSHYGGYRYKSRGSQIRKAIRSRDLYQGINVVHKMTMDYLPTSHRLNIFNYHNFPTKRKYIKDFRHQSQYHKYTKSHTLLMHWRSNNEHYVEVPLVKYGNTVVHLNHRIIHPKRSVIGTMKVKPRKGPNQMSIHYQPGRVFKAMALISLFSWIAIFIYIFHKRLVKNELRGNYVKQ